MNSVTIRRSVASLALGFTCAAYATETNHVHLAVSHAGEAIKWYTQHLDCTTIDGRDKAIDCGGMNIEFLERQSVGSSQGTGVNHISFSYPDVKKKMKALEDVGVRGSGVRLQRFEDGATLHALPGLYDHGFIFDPWGTRIELVGDGDQHGFHHVHLQSTEPAAALDWYASVLGGERGKLKGEAHGVKFGDVWLLIDPYPEGRPAATDERAIDHIGFAAPGLDAAAAAMRKKGVNVRDPAVPQNARTDAKRALLQGPDGVLIAVVEPGWAGVESVLQTAAVVPQSNASYDVPLTPWGEPDIQGIWTGNASHGIPLERSEEVEDVADLTPEQAAARRERGTLGSIWGYEREWRDTTLGYDKAAPSTQAAMIIDPADGRMPPMTEKGKAAVEKMMQAREYPKLAAGPEDLSNYVRCITRGLPSLMMPSIYNNGLQIQQSPGYVAIQKEMIHETRIVPTTKKPPLGPKLKQWLGHSRGYWDGDTLVVEVRGFNGRAAYRGAGEELTLTERYKRVGENKLEYTFTVDDPTVWEREWTGMFHFDKDDDQYDLVEYACHEGNYGMTNILSAARARDKENAQQVSKGTGD